MVWHYDGQMWTAQDVSTVVPSGVPTTLNKVWGSGVNDVYAVGETGIILHYGGSGWSLVRARPATPFHRSRQRLDRCGCRRIPGWTDRRKDGTGPFAARAPSTAPRLNGIFVPPSGDAIAVGVNLAVVARSASGWATVDEGSDPNLRDFHGVWIDPDDGIWAVGGRLSELSDGVLAYGGSQSVPGGPVQ